MDSVELPLQSVFARRYKVLRRIGSGGFGSVYEAQHVVTGRRCALKVLWSHFAAEEEFRLRFLQESRVAAHLENDYIVDVLDAGIEEDSDTPFIVMELLQGEDLAQRLKRKRRFTPEETTVYLSHVAVALDLTHDAAIIHRDLKPANLFLTRRSDGAPLVKILDYGVAKFLAEQSKAGVTQSAGTPLYMAPEQFRRSPITKAVDIYALGMLAFRFLAGAHYYSIERKHCDNAYALGIALAEGPPESATVRAARYGSELPASLDEWFARATNPDPKLRFDNASSAVLALCRALGVPPREPLVQKQPRMTGALSQMHDPQAFQSLLPGRAQLGAPANGAEGAPGSGTQAGGPPTPAYSRGEPNAPTKNIAQPASGTQRLDGTAAMSAPQPPAPVPPVKSTEMYTAVSATVADLAQSEVAAALEQTVDSTSLSAALSAGPTPVLPEPRTDPTPPSISAQLLSGPPTHVAPGTAPPRSGLPGWTFLALGAGVLLALLLAAGAVLWLTRPAPVPELARQPTVAVPAVAPAAPNATNVEPTAASASAATDPAPAPRETSGPPSASAPAAPSAQAEAPPPKPTTAPKPPKPGETPSTLYSRE